ncbi:dienelactone hydrolase family protein [Adhaeribacter sp. BT258]|uniref:Dienelactone hydrolase family protein n=1 Tax=Adhaeribacter terrigena TaxID=2793070 RepID=A0ABS1C3E0_9BACT|nr:dienelactone hydrolase family protein [Adhaeribacter terrigena]MBK0403838.1 dienelactone hydrolase family protein [Adhaeribacter terrigena]
MKKLLFSVLCWLAFMPFAFAQTKTSCCTKTAPEQFAVFASNLEFQAMHASPLPFTLEDPAGEMVNFPVAGGEEGRAYLVKATKPSDNYLIVVHEWWGLNDYIKQEADKFAKAMPHVNVIAVDLYDGRIADSASTAAEYMKEVSDERATGILKGAMAFAGKKAKFATIGWCFGGSWSLQAAILAGKNALGCVMYYGMPETDVKKLKSLKCDVLGIFAKKDQNITPKVVSEFQKKMKEAGKVLSVKTFDADHAFANPSSPTYNNTFSKQADKMALDYLKRKFAVKK